jgi:CNP1-like family protein
MKAATAFGCALLAAGCHSTEPMSDWERNNREMLATPQTAATPTPPPFPRRENLIEFYVGPRATFKYFVDSASLVPLWKQGEVRYVLVARSPSGVDNVSFEALRCAGQYRVMAVGNNQDRSWSARAGDWLNVDRKSDMQAQSRLKTQFFCPHNDPIQSTSEGIDALRKGGHPMVWLPENYDRR